jgi:hypothetical protein
MPFITVGTQSDIAPGTYAATLTAINEKMVPSKFNNGDDAPALEWVFALDNGDEVNGLTSTYTSPKSKAFGYLVALLGKERVQSGAEFELDDLIGKRALVQVGINDGGWPRVENVMPPMAEGKAKAKPVAVPAAPPSDDEGDLPF